MTLGEVLLWNELKQKRMLGYDFDRQKPIDNFIVDFYCKDLKLAIEVDGASHYVEGAFEKDKIRQKKLENLGVKFLRFDDEDMKQQMKGVVKEIEYWIENNSPFRRFDIKKENQQKLI